jgi:hypothetical protein
MAAKPIFVQAVDTNGTPYSGAKLNVYDAGTTTPRAIYTESGLGTASANPAIADANGVVVVWVNDAGGDIKVTLTNSAETVTPHNEDNVPIASLTCYPVITFQGDQSLLTTSIPTFAGLTLGNVSFAGVVTDPNADRLVFWDDSASQVNFMTLGTGLAFNGTALELDGDLQDISGLTPTDGGVIIGDGTDFGVETGATLRTSLGLGTGDSVTFAGLTLASGATVTAILDEDGLTSDSATAIPTQQSVKAYADSLAATIADINAISQSDGVFIVSDGTNWVGESGATARASLGLTIGTNVQAYDAGLTSIAGLTTAADKMIYATGLDTYAVTDLSAYARTLLDDASATAARATLGLTIGTDVQAYDAELAALASTTSAANKVPYFTGAGTASTLDFLDEDGMSSNSAAAVASQQSIKAYVDSQVGGNIADYTALKALAAGSYTSVLVEDNDRGGLFVWSASDNSANVTGDSEEGVYVPPSSDTSGASGAWVRQYNGFVKPEWYGADTGAADNSTAIQAIADSNLNCDFGGRSYPLTTGITLPANFTAHWRSLTLDISGAGNITAISGTGADFTTVDAAQSDASATTLSANASAGDTTISVTGGDSSGVSAGDYILISSLASWDADTALASEYQIVTSQAAGVITLDTPLRDEYLTADTAQVLRFASVMSPYFENIHILGAGGASSQKGIELYRTIRAKLYGVSGLDVRDRLVNVSCDLFTKMDNTHVEGSNRSGLGYGIAATGGWAGSYGSISGRTTRHAFTTGDRGSDGTNTPDYIVTREFQVGDIHMVDAHGAPFDSHPGAVDITVGNVSGNMHSGVSQEVCTLQGARVTVGDVSITGIENAGILIQSNGCGDATRENYYRLGTCRLSADGNSNNNFAVTIANSGPAGEAIDYISIGGVFSRADRGISVNPTNGDINRVCLGPSELFGENYDVLQVTDNASYRVKRIVAESARLVGNASGRYPVYYTGSSYSPSPEKFTTIMDFNNCDLVNLGTGAAMRTLGNVLVRFSNCHLSTNGTNDLVLDSGGNATIGYDGNINLREIIATGSADAIPEGLITLAAESGTADDLDTLTLSTDFFDCNGAYDANDMASMFIRCRVRPDNGDTITLKHAASGANKIRCPGGVDIVLSDRSHVAELVFMHDLLQWVVVSVTRAAESGTGETAGFTAGAGTAVLDDSTFTGNIGSTAYRVSDIVKALKNLGFIAS